MIVVTEDGKKIILNTDGTWEEYKEVSLSNTEFDVRKVNWGMNQAQIRETETLELIIDEADTVAYEGKLNNNACLIVYRFYNNKLSSMDYIFKHTYSDDARFVNDFETLKDSLIKKYGKPLESNRHFFSETYEDSYTDWGMALSTGELSFFTTWIVNQTKIMLALYGDNYEVSFILSYSGTEYEGSIQETNEQNLLNDL